MNANVAQQLLNHLQHHVIAEDQFNPQDHPPEADDDHDGVSCKRT